MESDKKLVFETQLTKEKYLSLNKQHQRKSLIIGFFFYIIIFFLVVQITNNFKLNSAFILVGIVGGVIISSLITGFSYLSMLFRSNRHFRDDKLLQVKQTYEIDESGIKTYSASGNGQIQWDEIFKIVESKDIFAIYIGRNRALILPKEDILSQSPDGIITLTDFITRNIQKNKVKFRK